MNDYTEIHPKPGQSVAPVSPAEEKHSFGKAEQILSFLSMLLGFLFIRFCCYHTSGAITTLLFWAITGVNLWYLHRSGKRFSSTHRVLTGILFLFGAVYTITANPFLKLLNTVFLVLLEAFLSYSVRHPEEPVLRYLPFSMQRAVFSEPFSRFGHCPRAAASVMKGGSGKNLLYVAGGLLLAVPLTFVVGALLASSDSNMARLFDCLLDLPEHGISTLFWHLVFGFLCGCWLFGALYASSVPEETVHLGYDARISKMRRFPNPMVYAMVTPICLLYVLYFFSQMSYFIGGFTGQLADGFTYAEYARHGFFELCTVCLINAFVIYDLAFCTKGSGTGKPLALRIYTLFLCIASLILAGTAMAKMCLYIRAYGMTQLRIYTSWFMLLLSIGFMLVIVRQFRPALPACKIGFAAFVLLFGLLCFSRPDAWITRYNAEMYLAGELEDFDLQMIHYELSDDAVSALMDYEHAFGSTEFPVREHPQIPAYTVPEVIDERLEDYASDNVYRTMNLSAWSILLKGAKR